MKIRELTKLRPLLEALPPQELCCLDDFQLDWLPKLRSLPPDSIPKAICDAAGVVEPWANLVSVFANIRCWLMQRLHFQPWDIYRFVEAPRMGGYMEFFNRMIRFLRLRGAYPTIAVNERENVVHACMVIEDADDRCMELGVMYMFFRTAHCLVAVHCLGGSIHPRLEAALYVAGCGVILIRNLPYTDLRRAIDDVRRFLGILTRNRRPQERLHSPAEFQRNLMSGGNFDASPPLEDAAESQEQVAAQPIPLCCDESGGDFWTQEALQAHNCEIDPT